MKAIILGSASLALLASLVLALCYPLNTSALGTVTQIGTTWYENQHNGTMGRMVALDSLGYAHCVWMNGQDAGATNRHVYYNFVDPAGAPGFGLYGTQVDMVYRAGYTTLDVGYGGRAFLCFHQILTQGSSITWPAIGADVVPHFGAFLVVQAPPLTGISQLVWPTMQIGRNGILHIIASGTIPSGTDPQYYISATYDPATYALIYAPAWTYVDSGMSATTDIGTSPVSDKVAFAWIGPDYDLYYLVDNDGLNPNFELKINLTQFTPADTFRLHTDLNVLIDQSDQVHLAFTTRSIYYDPNHVNASLIWHWTSQYPDSFRLIANAYDLNDTVACGYGEIKAQRPSLGQDPSTGYLYCLYHYYDTDPAHLSAGGWPSGEVYVSVSTDGGLDWSQGINITETITPGGAPAGQCYSEYCPSMAKWIDGNCRLLYVLDRDAGNVVQLEGSWTFNPVKYHRVPVDSIPTTPLLPQNISLHPGGAVYPIQITLGAGLPIIIPPGGGSFSYGITMTNVSSQGQVADGWIMVRLPNGAFYGPVLGPFMNMPFPAYVTISRLRQQYVPGSAPPGEYLYISYVGDYNHPSSFVGDSSYFPFTKTGSEDLSLGSGAWTNTGESFSTMEITVNDEIHNSSFIIHNLRASPNPFNPSTVLSFELRAESYVKVEVFDVNGRDVGARRCLAPLDGRPSGSPLQTWYPAGMHHITFDASDLPSGIYFVRLAVVEQAVVQKMILLK